jgi:hypothetical protein
MQQALQPEKELVAEALRFRSPHEPNMLDTIPSINYRLRYEPTQGLDFLK